MHRLIIDTNMLVVFTIGSVDPNFLGRIQRVKEYRPDDYEIIFIYISHFSKVILLPNIVSETSNLLSQMTGDRRELCMTKLASLVQESTEVYIESCLAVTQPEFIDLGATDTSILCALNDNTSLLTADLKLYLAALCRSQSVQRFQELRG